MDPRSISNPISRFQHTIRTDAAVVANYIVFSNHHPMTSVEPIADRGARIDHRSASDDTQSTDFGWQLTRQPAPRWLPNNGAILHKRSDTQVYVRMDHLDTSS
jgi:hypothetical protein